LYSSGAGSRAGWERRREAKVDRSVAIIVSALALAPLLGCDEPDDGSPAPDAVGELDAAEPIASADSPLMPDVLCLDLQEAQDTIQETGIFYSRSVDATGAGRRQVWDRNWVVVEQSPAAGETIGEGEAVLSVVKDDEPSGCGGDGEVALAAVPLSTTAPATTPSPTSIAAAYYHAAAAGRHNGGADDHPGGDDRSAGDHDDPVAGTADGGAPVALSAVRSQLRGCVRPDRIRRRLCRGEWERARVRARAGVRHRLRHLRP
jgi:hypothetical protein